MSEADYTGPGFPFTECDAASKPRQPSSGTTRRRSRCVQPRLALRLAPIHGPTSCLRFFCQWFSCSACGRDEGEGSELREAGPQGGGRSGVSEEARELAPRWAAGQVLALGEGRSAA
jgi:hypothetical protein